MDLHLPRISKEPVEKRPIYPHLLRLSWVMISPAETFLAYDFMDRSAPPSFMDRSAPPLFTDPPAETSYLQDMAPDNEYVNPRPVVDVIQDGQKPHMIGEAIEARAFNKFDDNDKDIEALYTG
ncbi:hypothetical protein L2E82_03245 [Cichorium intybus]|uniref:Uncharacterized protein n=1 Tax=Cichorium intybus TaxID=13427 RepID=A0ACB9H384_CICIN|nr:hypothetical protein L2E82_03245 [Cichorium intybus]